MSACGERPSVSAVEKPQSTGGRGSREGLKHTHTCTHSLCRSVCEPPGGGRLGPAGQSWCTVLSAWLTDTGPSWRRRCQWKVVLSEPTSSSSFSCSLANSMNTCGKKKNPCVDHVTCKDTNHPILKQVRHPSSYLLQGRLGQVVLLKVEALLG